MNKYLQSYCYDFQYRKTQNLKKIIQENLDKINIMEICYHNDHFCQIVLNENNKANITSFDSVDNNIHYTQIHNSERYDVIMGNTKYTLLKFIEKYPLKTFDIIFINRFYKDYNDVVEDINNSFLLANKDTIIMIESDSKNKLLKKAWKENISNKRISEIYNINSENDEGIIVGKYLFV